MEINEILKAKREEILCIAAKHGAHNVRIFGSVARGEADADSDVDILVDMERDGACWTVPLCCLTYNAFWVIR